MRVQLQLLPVIALQAICLSPAWARNSPTDTYMQYVETLKHTNQAADLTPFLPNPAHKVFPKTGEEKEKARLIEQNSLFTAKMLHPGNIKVIQQTVHGREATLNAEADPYAPIKGSLNGRDPDESIQDVSTNGIVHMIKQRGTWRVDWEKWSTESVAKTADGTIRAHRKENWELRSDATPIDLSKLNPQEYKENMLDLSRQNDSESTDEFIKQLRQNMMPR